VTTTARDAEEFVRTNARLGAPPLVPEIVLYLASEVVPLWHKTEEIQRGTQPPPYWAFAWPGGQALARYVLDHPEETRGKTALDFGAGSGLVAIAAAKTGAEVSAADIDAFSIAAVGLNATENGVTVGCTSDDLIGSPPKWDIILIGDMCYERPLAERLTAWLREATLSGVRVLMGDPGRSYFPATGVRKLASYEVPTSRDLEDRDSRTTSVYLLLPH
jgi:predicted nicotinamide N-methyase